MPIVVEAVEPQVFEQWLAARKAGQPTAIGHGPQPQELAAATSPAAGDMPSAAAAAPAPVETAAAPSPASGAPIPPAELMAQGEKVYNTQCAACHQATGLGLPPNFPALKGSVVANGPAEAHILQTLKGKNLMPGFPHLSDVDLAAAISYERQSWGNKGGVVQPAQVAAQRGK